MEESVWAMSSLHTLVEDLLMVSMLNTISSINYMVGWMNPCQF